MKVQTGYLYHIKDEFFDIVDITPQDFFYMGDHYNKEDKNILDLYNNLSQDGKQTILDLMKKLK